MSFLLLPYMEGIQSFLQTYEFVVVVRHNSSMWWIEKQIFRIIFRNIVLKIHFHRSHAGRMCEYISVVTIEKQLNKGTAPYPGSAAILIYAFIYEVIVDLLN